MVALPVGAVLTVCVCGRAHDAETWPRLVLLAFSGRLMAGARVTLETRRCECGAAVSLAVRS